MNAYCDEIRECFNNVARDLIKRLRCPQSRMQASKLKFPPAKYFEKFIVQLKRDPAEPVYFNLSRARESSNFSTVNSLSLSLSLSPKFLPREKK